MLRSPNGSELCPSWGIEVTESSQVGEARRRASAMAANLGFSPTGQGQVALAATEAGTNLIKHAGGGRLLLCPIDDGEGYVALDLLALDKGPGMADPDRCLRDGFSTAGTPGTGLGAIARLSDSFELSSAPGLGTALRARFRPERSRPESPTQSSPRLEIGAVHVPKPPEIACGDAWAVEHGPTSSRILVVDGLGHGPLAADASHAAVRAFRQSPWVPLPDLIWALHAALRSTRGAALAVAELDLEAGLLRYAGVGNIAGTIFLNSTSHGLVSHNGTAGHEVRKVQVFEYPFAPGSLLVMHSDGLSIPRRLDQMPGLASRSCPLIAGVLYRDLGRGRDDATVLAVRGGPP
ncbi:ATP-binding SpoIIE family protein phosphatase [Isosphaeraceae bacterium EP7]